LTGADDGEGLVGGKMRKSFFEGASERSKLRAGSDTQDGFAEAEDAVRSSFEGLRGRVACGAGDDHLKGMTGEQRCGEAVGGGKEAVPRSNAGEGFESFLGK